MLVSSGPAGPGEARCQPPGVNYWPQNKCAKAFWSQQEVPPYRELLADTLDWAAPAPGERWLDLGCGGGAISRAIWERTGGQVAGIVGRDCASANEDAYDDSGKACRRRRGRGSGSSATTSAPGWSRLADDGFDHAVSGLSISYAESFDESAGRWTTAAYDRLLAEVFRVIRPGGRFVFSVNVPEPWLKVARRSLPTMLRSGQPLKHLKNSWRMLKYGRWLKQEAQARPVPVSPGRGSVRSISRSQAGRRSGTS